MKLFAERYGEQQTRQAIIRHDIRILDGLTDQQLRDIGLDRSEIFGVVALGHTPARRGANA
jgi:uncharacterized protein YjiS (DUF1127 family)